MSYYNPPIDPPNPETLGSISSQSQTDPRLAAAAGLFWSFDMVEERLVETIELWRRMPSGGPSPFAKDGPWHLIQAEWGDYADADALPRKLPLSRAEYARMIESSAWLAWVQQRDRRLVVLAVTKLAQGHGQVPWMELRKPMGVALGAHGLRKRYGRAVQGICNRLNGGTSRSHASSPES